MKFPKEDLQRQLRIYFSWSWIGIGSCLLIGGAHAALLFYPELGVYTNAFVFAVLIGLALARPYVQKLALVLAIIPASNMVGMALLPPNMFWLGVTQYGSWLVFGVIYWLLFSRRPSLGSASTRLAAYVLLGGIAFGLFAFMVVGRPPAFTDSYWLLALTVIIGSAVAEELLFRGLIQEQGNKIMRLGNAAALSVVLYTILSFGAQSVWMPVVAFFASSILAGVYIRYRSLSLNVLLSSSMKIGMMLAAVWLM